MRRGANGARVVLVGVLSACPARQVGPPEPRPPETPTPTEVRAPAIDRDGDGVADGLDVCPEDAGEAPQGCPDLDRDGDGIPDEDDRCPENPEIRNNYEDVDGCPDEVPQQLEGLLGAPRAVRFAAGSADVGGDVKAVEMVARVMLEYPGLELLIRGHTDDREGGSPTKRRELSLRRAEAVRNYLIGRGVARERLEVQGAGPDEPIDVNSTRSGRAHNRRVAFTVVDG